MNLYKVGCAPQKQTRVSGTGEAVLGAGLTLLAVPVAIIGGFGLVMLLSSKK